MSCNDAMALFPAAGTRQNIPKRVQRAIRSSVAKYDQTGFPLVFNTIYDILQLSSGRDKVCAFIQNGAKFASDALAKSDSEFYYICRGMEDSLSDGRKVSNRLSHTLPPAPIHVSFIFHQ